MLQELDNLVIQHSTSTTTTASSSLPSDLDLDGHSAHMAHEEDSASEDEDVVQGGNQTLKTLPPKP